jgi:glycerol kinase
MRRAAALHDVRISGGMARCDYLCQSLADLCGLEVRRHELREATARGVAFLAAGEPRGWHDVPLERAFKPLANEPLTARHRRWLAEMARRGAVAP